MGDVILCISIKMWLYLCFPFIFACWLFGHLEIGIWNYEILFLNKSMNKRSISERTLLQWSFSYKCVKASVIVESTGGIFYVKIKYEVYAVRRGIKTSRRRGQ